MNIYTYMDILKMMIFVDKIILLVKNVYTLYIILIIMYIKAKIINIYVFERER